MTVFEIRNSTAKEKLLGYLFYYDRSRRFFTELLDGIDEWECPFIFSGHVKRGIYSIDSVWSSKFVQQRIIPSDRQNLGSILRDNNLKEYDEYRLLLLSEGRCAQDELRLRRIAEKDIADEIKKRLRKKISDVMVLSGFRVLVFFKNGDSRIADIKMLCEKDRLFGNILKDEGVFRNVRVSPGGNGIEWGEERFVSAESLRTNGKKADILYDDILGFINDRLSDSAGAAKTLHCSRQYIKQLTDKERLIPVRERASYNIYTKSSLERED